MSTDQQSVRETRIGLDRQASSSLLTRIIPIDHPPALWPTSAAGATAQALAPVRAAMLRTLWDGPGWMVIDTGLAGQDDDELASALWNLLTALCQPVPQYRTGELVHLVRVSDEPAQAASAYSQTNLSGTFHTDGTLLDTTPQIAMLAGIRRADEGGETVIIDAQPVVDLLAEGPAPYLEALAAPHPFHSADDADPVARHKIIDRDARPVVVRYNPRYLTFGYAKEGCDVPDPLQQATTALDSLAADPRQHVPVLIERGQALLWNNLRCLHGRYSFRDGRQRRCLLRAYGMRLQAA